MDKRYQVFVSSTYADLQDERQKVIQTLMALGCIPAGMELFPAVDQDQLEFIKKVIDDCDYYILIIGGRYGSTTADGVSYTEKEYEYAKERGLKVIALLHKNPDLLPVAKTDKDPARDERLKKFRERASTGRLVRYWEKAEELPGLVALNLPFTIRMFPAIGWVRANKVANEQVLDEINQIRKENDKLKEELENTGRLNRISIPDIAGLDESFEVTGSEMVHDHLQNWKINISWREIFSSISPSLLKSVAEETAYSIVTNRLAAKAGARGDYPDIDISILQTIGIQLKAHGLIDISERGGMSYWSLTPEGERVMFETRVVRTSQKSA